MATVKAKCADVLYDTVLEYTKKLRMGEIKSPCDEFCSDDCDGEHCYPSDKEMANLWEKVTMVVTDGFFEKGE